MIMSMRLKKLLALSLSVSLVSTGIFVDVGMRSVTAVASKTKQAKDKKNVKKVKVTVAQKKTIKAPKSEKKAVWSILSGKQLPLKTEKKSPRKKRLPASHGPARKHLTPIQYSVVHHQLLTTCLYPISARFFLPRSG